MLIEPWSAGCWVDKIVLINQLEAPVCKEKYLCKIVQKTILNTIVSNVNSGPKYETLAFALINKCFKKIQIFFIHLKIIWRIWKGKKWLRVAGKNLVQLSSFQISKKQLKFQI